MLRSAKRLYKGLQGRRRRVVGRVAGTLVRVATPVQAAALTFDDGPHPEYTPELLAILDAYGARATFFMIGQNAAKYPDVVEKVAAAGSVVANHTWDHPIMPSIPGRERDRQLRACQTATAPYGQPFFRPPRSLQSIASFVTARRLGFEVVAWSGEIGDWRAQSADYMTDQLMDRVGPGKIVVLHDNLWNPTDRAAQDRGPLLVAVKAVLDELADRFHFVTIPELMALGRPIRKPWFYATDNDWPAA